jgi:predicted nucleic acid-binding protein
VACIDTTVLIDLVGSKSKYREKALFKIDQLIQRNETLVTTRFNIAELYVGVERSANQKSEEQVIHHLLKFISVLEFDDMAARLFGQITAYLQTIGKPAGDMDVLIAATAMVSNHILITRNSKHFMNIPELMVEEY